VVAERDDIRARGEQPVPELRRQTAPVRRVLAVDDAEVDAELLAQRVQPRLDRLATRSAEDVCDEEDPQRAQRNASVAAGCTSIVTWFPASCV
jgi:hypothetical protein